LLKTFDWLVSVFVSNKAVRSSESIPFNQEIESKLQEVTREFESVYGHKGFALIKDFYKVQTDIGQDENWKAFPFIVYNFSFEKNMQRCPETTALLNRIPGCTSAMFSLLLPGKHILPHKGVYKGVI